MSGIAHQGGAGSTRPGVSLMGIPQAAKAAWACSTQDSTNLDGYAAQACIHGLLLVQDYMGWYAGEHQPACLCGLSPSMPAADKLTEHLCGINCVHLSPAA